MRAKRECEKKHNRAQQRERTKNFEKKRFFKHKQKGEKKGLSGAKGLLFLSCGVLVSLLRILLIS
jgi:hypothetical protein